MMADRNNLTPAAGRENELPILAEKPSVNFRVKLRAQAENLLVLAVGGLGLISSFFMSGKGGSRVMDVSVFPRLIYLLMTISGVGMFLSRNKYAPPPKERDVPILFLLASIAALGVYFLCVYYIGLLTATVGFLLLLFILLNPEPRRHMRSILLATAVGTALLWVVYELAIGIFLPQAMLF